VSADGVTRSTASPTPVRDREWALFLDVDGTVLEIARGPHAVHVSTRLQLALTTAAARESGALALVSGRRIGDLDLLFQPHRLAAAGVHGLERRDALGRMIRQPVAPDALDGARKRLKELASARPGILLEDKGGALAVHYRQVLHLEGEVIAIVEAIAADLGPGFHAQHGKCVVEIKPAGYSKGAAIEAFMGEAPFAGRLPVFVGDDATDEDGFVAVNAQGGLSIRVGYGGRTAARWRFTDVNEVIRWLVTPEQAHGRRIPAEQSP
jgi:trehalose 6-phosphate phosphatase